MTTKIFPILLLFFSLSCFAAGQSKLNLKLIESLTGAMGKYNVKDQSFKISLPRNNLSLPFTSSDMGLISSVTFKKVEDNTVITGDLVLREDQVNPMLIYILKNNLRVTGLRSQIPSDLSRIMFMHIEGEGTEKAVAAAIGTIFSMLKKTSQAEEDFPLALVDSASSLNPHHIDTALGLKGKMADGLYKIIMSNKAKVNVKPSHYLNLNSWAAFSGSDSEGMVFGDLTTPEVNLKNVVAALNEADINVMTIQQQTSNTQPLIVLHYLGVGNTSKLAHGVRNAVIATTLTVPAPVKIINRNLKLYNNTKFCPINGIDQYLTLVNS